MNKRAKVHLLPTNKAENCIIRSQNDDMFYHQGALLTQEYLKSGHGVIGLQSRTSHHLYITTDDEIKEGDWYVLTKNDGTPTTILKATVDGGSLKFNSEKIIATTDPELHNTRLKDCPVNPEENMVSVRGISKPSKEFIKEYCELGGIDEVDVEYGLFHDGNFKEDDETHAFKAIRKPRVNSHNEIIIHSIGEKMYTESELIQFVLDNKFKIDSDTTREEITNWIKIRKKTKMAKGKR